jgi:uncharacterized protein
MRTMNAKTALITLGACVFAACSPLAPQPDNSRFFILTPISNSGTPVTDTTSQLSIGIGPIDFPDYLKRPQVITLEEPNRIDLSQDRRWGEPLDKDFARIFSENMSQLLDTQRIEKYPWSRKVDIDYQIEVDVIQFETIASGRSQLKTRWIIRDGKGGKELYASETDSSSPVDKTEAGAAAALSKDVGTLSRDIATRISALSQRKASRAAIPPPLGAK